MHIVPKISDEERCILRRLSENPLMDGSEIMEISNGDFQKAKITLNQLLSSGVIKLKGNLYDEKDLYYSTIISSPFKVKKALG